jgi:hypothetical protein
VRVLVVLKHVDQAHHVQATPQASEHRGLAANVVDVLPLALRRDARQI